MKASEERSVAGMALVVRWMARVLSVFITALIVLMATDGAGLPTAAEAAVLALFPGGVVAGFVIAWRRERAGGLITVLSLAGFYVLMAVMGRVTGPYFLAAAAPGFLFL